MEENREDGKIKSLEELKREMFGDPNEVFRDAKKEFWDEARSAKGEKAPAAVEEAVVEAPEPAAPPVAPQTAVPAAVPVDTAPAQTESRDDVRKDFEELKGFYDLVDRARYGEYDAYLELERVAGSDSEYSAPARRNFASIKAFLISDYFEMLTMLGGSGHVSENKKINYDKTPIGELFGYIATFDVPHDTRRCCASFVLDGEHPEILNGALGILKGSNNLYALASVTGILTDKFGKKAGFLDVDGWKKYCENKLDGFEKTRQGRR